MTTLTTDHITALITKNIKLLIRARASALIIILGPLLLIFLAGLAFDNTNTYAIKIGTYSQAYNDLSNSFIERLAKANFQITRYNNEQNCIENIQQGTIHTCLTFSPNFELNNNASNTIDFHIDYAKLNLVWTILNAMTSKISSRNQELSKNLTAQVLSALEDTKKTITERKQTLSTLVNNNDHATKLITETRLKLEELDVTIDPVEIGLTNLSNNKDRVKHWVQNSLSIAESSLAKANSFIKIADTIVKGSSASDEIKTALNDFLDDTIDDLGRLQERFSTTQTVVQEEFATYDELLSSIIGKITQLKAKLDAASAVRDTGLQDLDKAKQLLDASLVEILLVQKSLNTLEHKISTLQVTDASTLISPITTTIKPVVAEKSYLNYLFPTLTALIILFTTLLIAPLIIILENNSSARLRNHLTPTSDYNTLFATYTTCLLLVSTQLIIILILAALFFTTSILSNIITTLIAALLIITTFTLLGMIIGYSLTSETTATITSVTLSSILLFLSDTIIPLETMPPWMTTLMKYNPFVISSDLLRKTLIYHHNIIETWQPTILLLIYSSIFILTVLALHHKVTKDNLTKLIKKMVKK